jgi:hypothetical protein
VAGRDSQGINAIAIGNQAGNDSQGDFATGIGFYAGRIQQGTYAVGVGWGAGGNQQGTHAVAIGPDAGNDSQGEYGIGIGYQAGRIEQGQYSVAMGYHAGRDSQGDSCIAIGGSAGRIRQGRHSIAIGAFAGENVQGANGIILSAKGTVINDTTDGHIHIASDVGSFDFTDAAGWSTSTDHPITFGGGVVNKTKMLATADSPYTVTTGVHTLLALAANTCQIVFPAHNSVTLGQTYKYINDGTATITPTSTSAFFGQTIAIGTSESRTFVAGSDGWYVGN